MAALDRAIEIAASALAGKVDKAGEPLILHVCRVVLAVERYFPPGPERDEARVAAALHDVFEDGFTGNLIHCGFGRSVADAVEALTRRSGEEYLGAYIPRVIAAGRIARFVKLADLDDNLRRVIPGEPARARNSRIRRYERARHDICVALLNHPELAAREAEAGAAQGEGRPRE